jgi:lipopolysaccharide/colanic/teichoic acid biosynthesis glycosyltransferase
MRLANDPNPIPGSFRGAAPRPRPAPHSLRGRPGQHRGQRAADLALLVLALPLALPLFALVGLAVLLADGRPVFYGSERIGHGGRPFRLWKFRTMRHRPGPARPSGGPEARRITPLGARLRRCRLDELPQLLNIARGEMGFVGPRPPLRRFVALRPALYGRVLRARPGLTGAATLAYHAREARLMAACRTDGEAEALYLARCVPIKARLDLAYAARRSIASDLALLVATLWRVFVGRQPRRPGARRPGRRAGPGIAALSRGSPVRPPGPPLARGRGLPVPGAAHLGRPSPP